MQRVVSISRKQAAEYSAMGYFVIQNTAPGHVQITDEGHHVKSGQTMAVLEFDSYCEKAYQRGLIKVISRPEDSSKKPKKRSADNEETLPKTVAAPISNPASPVDDQEIAAKNVADSTISSLSQEKTPEESQDSPQV